MGRLARMSRTLVSPAGLRSADDSRQYFLGQAKAFGESAEGPAAKDCCAGIEFASDEELLDQYSKAGKDRK